MTPPKRQTLPEGGTFHRGTRHGHIGSGSAIVARHGSCRAPPACQNGRARGCSERADRHGPHMALAWALLAPHGAS